MKNKPHSKSDYSISNVENRDGFVNYDLPDLFRVIFNVDLHVENGKYSCSYTAGLAGDKLPNMQTGGQINGEPLPGELKDVKAFAKLMGRLFQGAITGLDAEFKAQKSGKAAMRFIDPSKKKQ